MADVYSKRLGDLAIRPSTSLVAIAAAAIILALNIIRLLQTCNLHRPAIG